MRLVSAVLSALVFAAAASVAQAQDEVVVTGGTAPVTENAESIRLREAVAYASPLPRDAPTGDFALVAWCEALVRGHVAIGESLEDLDDLGLELIELGRIEAASFARALAVSSGRQTETTLSAARAAATAASARWAPLMDEDAEVRAQAFGLFMGLPGRCEHAARRLRDGVVAPPATLAEVGLED